MSRPEPPEDTFLAEHVLVSLVEDIGDGDVTTDSIVDEQETARGRLRAKQEGVLSGRRLLDVTYQVLAEALQTGIEAPEVTWAARDGDRVEPGDVLAEFEGPYSLLLSGERVALNYCQQLSGIATTTRQYVDVASQYDTRVYDTRKTVPHMRKLHKYAVRCGGGYNHRETLADAVMVKDNHKRSAGGLAEALERVDDSRPLVVEIHETSELDELGNFDIDVIMLDNFSASELDEFLDRVPDRCDVEVSGGITLDTLEAYCQRDIDRVSVGALTHSYDSLDLSIELIHDGR
jgi:nicotinate-nucleotide pyrophosphorylase (carboxylating)